VHWQLVAAKTANKYVRTVEFQHLPDQPFSIHVAFFMCKGADCLSKWVSEAERQLHLPFKEARNLQPSIIFFDEIT